MSSERQPEQIDSQKPRLLFLYRNVLELEFEWLDDVIQPTNFDSIYRTYRVGGARPISSQPARDGYDDLRPCYAVDQSFFKRRCSMR